MANQFGGSKHKRYKKKPTVSKKEEVPYKDGNRIYATVVSRLGGKRIKVMCDDNIDRQAIIPGSMYKRSWLNAGDVILVQVEDILKGDCTIVYKYNEVQIRKLKSEKAFGFKVEGSIHQDDIVFGDDDQMDSDDEENVYKEIDQLTISAPNKLGKKERDLKRLNDRSKKQDADINDLPEVDKEIDFDNL